MFNKLEKNFLKIIPNNPKLILGLSGGPDSVFLFHFLKNLHEKKQITLVCAHLDHGWRKTSKDDAKFCKNLCNQHKIKCVVEQVKNINLDVKFNGSQEEFGRNLRRHFLEKILKAEKANYITLAHHLQDQQETFLFRIMRGSTLSGLTCMKNIDQQYLRPLLNIQKKDILDFLNKNNIKYLEDETNNSEMFLRNRIRKLVLPQIKKCDDRFDNKFLSTLKNLQEEEVFLKQLTIVNFNKIFDQKNNYYSGNLKNFISSPNVIQKRLLVFWLSKENVKFSLSENYLKEILKFLKGPNGGSHKLSLNWQINKKKNSFWIEKASI